jgi:hypothetical protein
MEALNEAQVNGVLRRLQSRFRWTERSDAFVLVGTWSSRTATFYRCRGREGRPDVILKLGHSWTEADARELYTGMAALAERLGAAGAGSTIPSVLGWDARPPALCMAHVEGDDAIFLYADLRHPAWPSVPGTPPTLAAGCGRTLGAYHSLFPSEGGSTPGSRAKEEIKEAAATMRLRGRRLLEALGAAVEAGCYGDIGPHQFRVATNGDLFLLDPPPVPARGSVHGDLARFLFVLDKALARNRHLPGRQRQRLAADLREAFYGGYADTGPTDPRDPAGRLLTALHLGHALAGTARRRMRDGHRREGVLFAARWLRLLAAIRSGPGR